VSDEFQGSLHRLNASEQLILLDVSFLEEIFDAELIFKSRTTFIDVAGGFPLD
jgi:hypothetical protein